MFHLIKKRGIPPVFNTDAAGAAQDRKTDHTRPVFEKQNAVIPSANPGGGGVFCWGEVGLLLDPQKSFEKSGGGGV